MAGTIADFLNKTEDGLLKLHKLEKRFRINCLYIVRSSVYSDKPELSELTEAVQKSVNETIKLHDIPASYTVRGDTDAINSELEFYKKAKCCIKNFGNNIFDRDIIPYISYDFDKKMNDEQLEIFAEIIETLIPNEFHQLSLENKKRY